VTSGTENDWQTFSEHLRLLEAVEQYGYGNWEDIVRSIHLATAAATPESANLSKKTAVQAKDEFCQVFLNSTIGDCCMGLISFRGSF
jgi:hypothetical protein